MKNNLQTKGIALIGIVSLIAVLVLFILPKDNTSESSPEDFTELRVQHKAFLDNSPFVESKKLTKKERKSKALPPNPYNEYMWELTMNPRLGYPTPNKVLEYQMERNLQLDAAQRAPGNPNDNSWIERGPFDTGGRTRMVVFDPNDTNARRAFAGGVSGGLWVNEDVTSPNTIWQFVEDVPSNMAVTCIAFDPQDSQTVYIGTGESYTSGAANGNGVYKSEDGGNSWTRVVVQPAGGDTFAQADNDLFLSGIFYINDIEAWVNPDTNDTEIFIAVGASTYAGTGGGFASNPTNDIGFQNAGIYRTVNDGSDWNRIESSNMSYDFNGEDYYFIPNSFQTSADNTLYMSTTEEFSFGSRSTLSDGGRIYNTTNGSTWTFVDELPNCARTELAASADDPGMLYAVCDGTTNAEPVKIFRTTDAFATSSTTNLPDDADNGIPTNDYTRGQAFYDLMLSVSPDNDRVIYVGGIDVHRSSNGGISWTQISKWSNNPNLNTLNVPFVHADIHTLVFRPGNANQALIGSDGGVSYANSLSSAGFDETAISNRNSGYNTTQFYYGSIALQDIADGDDLAGGTQDNGTQFADDIPDGQISPFFDPVGGDGAYTDIDAEDGYVVTAYTGETHLYIEYPVTGGSDAYFLANTGDGEFINPAELDKNLNILYTNSRDGSDVFIGRYSNFTGGEAGITVANLIDPDIRNSNPIAFKVSPYTTDSTTLLVGTSDSQVLRVDNANDNAAFTNITGPDFLGSVSDMEFGQTENEIYVTFHNYGVESIMQTLDGGITWTSKEGNLPDIPVKCILQNPLNPLEVIIGTEMGVFSTANILDPNPTWVPSNSGMRDVRVLDLDLRPADNTVLATTHGRGMFTGEFSATFSVNDENRVSPINVFPSVAETTVNIVSNTGAEGSIKVYDLNGRLQLENTLEANSQTALDISQLSSGVYIISLNQGSKNSFQTKFVKR